MTDEEIGKAVNAALIPIIRAQPNRERQVEVMSYVLQLGYELLRGEEGDQFIRGWIDAAIADLATNPPKVKMVTMQ